MGREYSSDLVQPQWRTNFSFSPPAPSRIWDCRLQTDSLLNRPAVSVHGTSISSNSKDRRSVLGRRTNHHHSVSDGVLSYSDCRPDVQAPRSTSPIQNLNVDVFSNPSVRVDRGPTLVRRWLPRTSERQSAASCSYSSPFTLAESGPWDSSGRQPTAVFPSRNFPSRRSFKSKHVYPLLTHNPVSDGDNTGDADSCSSFRLTPDVGTILPSHRPDYSTRTLQEFGTLSELQKIDASPDPSSILRIESYRRSSSSSYEMGYDGEHFDISENIDVDSLGSPSYQMDDHKCGICVKFLRQKSPWGSNKMMKNGDLPVAGVLPCGHVFHAECLEQVIPSPLIHDPPCPLQPLCLELSGHSSPLSEPLIMALRSVRSREATIRNAAENSGIDVLNYMERDTLGISYSARSRFRSGSKLRKHFSSKGKMAKNFFRSKVFRRK